MDTVYLKVKGGKFHRAVRGEGGLLTYEACNLDIASYQIVTREEVQEHRRCRRCFKEG